MILQSLHELYDRLASDPDYEIAKPGYSPQKISFRIILKPDGSLFAIQDARIKNDKGKAFAETQLVLGEAKPPGAGLNPCLLWDNTSYLLGYKQPDKNPTKAEKEVARALEAFDKSKEKHLALESVINTSSFSSVCRFFENWDPTRILRLSQIGRISTEVAALDDLITNSETTPEKTEQHTQQRDKLIEQQKELEHEAGDDCKLFKNINDFATGFGIFEIQGKTLPVHENPDVIKWWEDQKKTASHGDLGQCLITGEEAPIARLHTKIKSVAGAQSSGASLVSFNAPAYESYGKDQSFNAPVAEDAAFKYSTSLNSLLSGPKSSKHRMRIGDTTCVFWTDKPSILEECAGFFFSAGSNAVEESQDPGVRQKVELLLQALQQGKEVFDELGEDPDHTRFYILGLAPNAARLSIRFSHQSSVTEFLENLRSHHKDLSIIREFEEAKGKRLPDPEFPANWQLLKESARVPDEIPPLLGGSLMRAILENTRYPEGLYSAVIRRIRADRTINYFRACIIKGTLTRNHNQTIPIMLDKENKEPAYLLGRLFSVLEKTQEDALGSLNAGIRDKFYSSASATPASVFPRILRTYQHHLAKLKGGQKVNREKLIQEIIDGLDEFPSHLNMKKQGLFAIGYYHQRKAFFTKKETPETNESESN